MAMDGLMENMIFGLVLVVVGVALVPVVFTTIGSANFSLVSGGTTYDLAWVGYIVGLLFAIVLVAIGVSVVRKAFKGGN